MNLSNHPCRRAAIMRRAALCLAFLVAHLNAGFTHAAKQDDSKWMIQDDIGEDAIHRIEARVGSVQRDGIWSQFDQRLVIKERVGGKGLVEMRRIAVNCLTGAWDIIVSKTYDLTPEMAAKPASESSKPLADVETTTMFRIDPLLIDQASGLDKEIFVFGCRCGAATAAARSPKANKPQSKQADIKRVYQNDVLSLPRQREYRVAMIKVDERSQALEVIKRLERGAKFEQLADEINSEIVRKAHPRGDLGFHHESRWHPPEVRTVLRKLKVGEYTREPLAGVFGFDVFKLLDLRMIAPPTLEQARPRIEAYLRAERACGRPA